MCDRRDIFSLTMNVILGWSRLISALKMVYVTENVEMCFIVLYNL